MSHPKKNKVYIIYLKILINPFSLSLSYPCLYQSLSFAYFQEQRNGSLLQGKKHSTRPVLHEK